MADVMADIERVYEQRKSVYDAKEHAKVTQVKRLKFVDSLRTFHGKTAYGKAPKYAPKPHEPRDVQVDSEPDGKLQAATMFLIESDKYRKGGDFGSAENGIHLAINLAKALRKEGYEGEAKKIAQAGSDRLARIFYQAGDNFPAIRASYNSIKKIDQEFGVQPRRPKHKGLEGTVAVVGLVLGLFFLSPSLTANVIGNDSLVFPSFIGALLFGVGLLGTYFWVMNR